MNITDVLIDSNTHSTNEYIDKFNKLYSLITKYANKNNRHDNKLLAEELNNVPFMLPGIRAQLSVKDNNYLNDIIGFQDANHINFFNIFSTLIKSYIQTKNKNAGDLIVEKLKTDIYRSMMPGICIQLSAEEKAIIDNIICA